jgi:hypothetical protein
MEVGLFASARVGTLEASYELTEQLLLGGESLLQKVHEPRPGCISQGHREVVGHDSLIPSYSEDTGGIDLQKLYGVDGPIVLLRQVGPELVQPYHHAEMRS